MAETDADADGTSGMPHPERYTITPRALGLYHEFSLFRLNMDTWYYSEWADPNHSATLGRMTLREGALTAAQGVASFVARQVTDFRDAFSELFSPSGVQVWYKPRLSGVRFLNVDFPAPENAADVLAIQTTLERSAHLFEGITGISINYSMQATVHDDAGRLAQVWLPYRKPARKPLLSSGG